MPKQLPSVCLWTWGGSGFFTSWKDSIFLSRYKSGGFAWRIQRDGVDDPGRFTIWRSPQFSSGRRALNELRKALTDDQFDNVDQRIALLVRLIPAVCEFDSRLGAEFGKAVSMDLRAMAPNVIPISAHKNFGLKRKRTK